MSIPDVQRPFMLQLLCKEKEQTLTPQSVTTVSRVEVVTETQKVLQGKVIICSSVDVLLERKRKMH